MQSYTKAPDARMSLGLIQLRMIGGATRSFIYAYERLKLEMDRLKKHEDELDFFARELQCRRILHGDWERVSELKFFGWTIPLKIAERTIAPKRRTIFRKTLTLPTIKMPPA